jgi:carbamoylphosphate synthase large subunit
MHVILVAPEFPANQRQFARGLREVGARVTGIGERPLDWLGPELRQNLHHYEQIRSVCHEPELLAAVRRIQGKGWVDRLEATIEAHILPTARVREAAGIPGMTEQAALVCRDKPIMKDFLRKRGIATAQSLGSADRQEIVDFAQREGFPLIIKPRDGAGAAGTFRVNDLAGLHKALDASGLNDGHGVAVEEFIEGHEGFYDTLSIDGVPRLEFISHYYPGVLEGMRRRDVSPMILSTNRVAAPGYDEVKAMGRKVIAELGLGTTATHMEWFFGPKGLKFSEIGARPPGVCHWDVYNAGNDIDLYRQWAMALNSGRIDQEPSRRFASGIINLRPTQDGHIVGFSGVDELNGRYGQFIVDAHLPSPGTPTQPVEAGFMANAWVRLRHPDYDTLRGMMDHIGQMVTVHAR